MSTSGKSVILPGISGNKKRDSEKLDGPVSTHSIRKRADEPPTLLRKNTNDPQTMMNHRREKGELPSLLNRSARVEPEIEKTAKKGDRSLEVKPTYKDAELSRGNTILSKELNGVGVSAMEDDDYQNQSVLLRNMVEKKEKDREKTAQELDDKMKLWNNIIGQRKKIYNKMIQDINAGHEGDLENEDEYNSKRKRQARKAALQQKLNKGGNETRIVIEKDNMKNSLDKVSIEEFKTPEDYLNSQITAIFQDTLQNEARIDYRQLGLYSREYEKVVKTKKQMEQLDKDISELRSVANGSRITK